MLPEREREIIFIYTPMVYYNNRERETQREGETDKQRETGAETERQRHRE